jgi:ATP-dependent protease HslVU (ClpYQ) peptidase subunit
MQAMRITLRALRIQRFQNVPAVRAVELAKDWRTDRYLRRLEAMMIVARPSLWRVRGAEATWQKEKRR